MVSHTILAEKVGFESVWMSETRFMRDAFTMLGAFACATSRMKLATAVVNPYTRNPTLTAISLANLDEVSGGRAIFGIGAGSPAILRHEGISLDKPLRAVRENIEIVRRLLNGENVTYSGSLVSLKDVKLDLRPVRDRIPVYVGATGPRMLRLAGSIADGAILNAPTSTEYVRRAVGLVTDSAESSGRNRDEIDIACCVDCAVSDRSEDAKDVVRPIIATYLAHFPAIANASQVGRDLVEKVRSAVLTMGSEAAAHLIDDALVNSLTAAGTEDELISRVEEYVKAGVALPVLFPHGTEEHITLAIKTLADYKIKSN
jgi:5,10-methylenetetrahydromethanopterin reductase